MTTTIEDAIASLYRGSQPVSVNTLLEDAQGLGREAKWHLTSSFSHSFRRLKVDGLRRFCEAARDYNLLVARMAFQWDDHYGEGRLLDIAREYHNMGLHAAELIPEEINITLDADTRRMILRAQNAALDSLSADTDGLLTLYTQHGHDSNFRQKTFAAFCYEQFQRHLAASRLTGANGYSPLNKRLEAVGLLYYELSKEIGLGDYLVCGSQIQG